MAGILTTAGIRSLGTYAGTVQNWLKSLTLRLYSNPHTPDPASDINASYTQASFSGYVAAAWNSWGTPVLNANFHDQYTHPDVVFTVASGGLTNQIYGYYATDAAGDVVLAEDNGVTGGQAMATIGSTYTVSGKFYSGQLAGTP